MTLVEAIKSGKPFRRKGAKKWFIIAWVHTDDKLPVLMGAYNHADAEPVIKTMEDLLANDWEN